MTLYYECLNSSEKRRQAHTGTPYLVEWLGRGHISWVTFRVPLSLWVQELPGREELSGRGCWENGKEECPAPASPGHL